MAGTRCLGREPAMQLFSCNHCHAPIFFDNFACTACGDRLAFLPDLRTMSALEELSAADEHAQLYGALAAPTRCYRMCRNAEKYDACNWAVEQDDPEELCIACRLNDVIPNIDEPKQRAAWLQLEAAKRRLMYSLYLLKLPVEPRAQRPLNGLSFRFMAGEKEKQVFTGHNDGVITINVAEADDPFREKMRAQLGEAYRTLLGHFRHEIGHYYWDRLIKGTRHLTTYRELFGDESVSYQQALQRHYKEGPPRDWANEYVSAYASMHPWEDWAETWAHYLHIFDTLETAKTYGLRVQFGTGTASGERLVDAAEVDVDNFDKMARDWVPVTLALNSLNRSMGLRDLYPFVLTETALKKLRFVHEIIRNAGHAASRVSSSEATMVAIGGEAREAADARDEANQRLPANDVLSGSSDERTSRVQRIRGPDDDFFRSEPHPEQQTAVAS